MVLERKKQQILYKFENLEAIKCGRIFIISSTKVQVV